MEQFLVGFGLIFELQNIILMVLGLVVGIVIGAIPGLNVPLAGRLRCLSPSACRRWPGCRC